MNQYPCKDCKDRILGCHAKCKRYLAAKAKSEKEKAEKRRLYLIECRLDDERGEKIRAAEKARRRSSRHG